MSTSGLADWATFRCLGDFLKPVAAMYQSKLPTFLDNFEEGSNIENYAFAIFGQPFIDIG